MLKPLWNSNQRLDRVFQTALGALSLIAESDLVTPRMQSILAVLDSHLKMGLGKSLETPNFLCNLKENLPQS